MADDQQAASQIPELLRVSARSQALPNHQHQETREAQEVFSVERYLPLLHPRPPLPTSFGWRERWVGRSLPFFCPSVSIK